MLRGGSIRQQVGRGIMKSMSEGWVRGEERRGEERMKGRGGWQEEQKCSVKQNDMGTLKSKGSGASVFKESKG